MRRRLLSEGQFLPPTWNHALRFVPISYFTAGLGIDPKYVTPVQLEVTRLGLACCLLGHVDLQELFLMFV